MKCAALRSWNARIADRLRHGRPLEALQIYALLLRAGIHPNPRTFIYLLKACAAIPDLARGAELHKDARRRGFMPHLFLCNTIISMYGKCGAAMEAEDAFCSMPDRSTVSWNVMMAAYADHGCGDKVLRLFRQMLEEGGVLPDQYTLALAIRACSAAAPQSDREDERSNASMGPKSGFGSNGNAADLNRNKMSYLEEKPSASMGPKSGFGSIGNAADPNRNKMSYLKEQPNALMDPKSGFALNGNAADPSCNKMSYLEEKPNTSMGPKSGFGSNGNAADPNRNKMSYLEEQPNTLMDPKSGFGSNGNAADPDRNKMSYLEEKPNASMRPKSGFGSNGNAADPNRNKMSYLEEKPNASMRPKSGFGSNGNAADSNLNKMSYFEEKPNTSMGSKSGFGSNGNVADPNRNKMSYLEEQPNAWMDPKLGFGSNGNAADPNRNKMSYLEEKPKASMGPTPGFGSNANAADSNRNKTSYLKEKPKASMGPKSGFGSNGNAADSNINKMSYFEEKPNASMGSKSGFGSNDDALDLNWNRNKIASMDLKSGFGSNDEALDLDPNRNKTSYLEIGRALHSYAVKRGLACGGMLLKNSLVSMYGRCGRVSEAENVVYSSLPCRDVVTWSAIISIYVGCGEGEKALLSYMQMHREGVDPDRVSCILALQACTCIAEREPACFVEEGEIKAKALEVGRALQADLEKKGYACDERVATALVGMYGKCGAIPNAERVFSEAINRDLVSWNAMLSAYVERSQGEKALELYREMCKANAGMDEVTIISSLRACEETGSLELCRELHFVAISSGWEKPISVVATLIHAYASCAAILEADSLHDALAERDLVSWTALLASQGARSEEDSRIFEQSKLEGILPDEVMFTSLLATFSHAGLVARALRYFGSMVREYGITPQLKQFGIVIDLLGRAGDLRRAESLVRNMPVRPDLAIAGFLLGACATHGDIGLAKQAFDFAMILEPHQANAYVFMSNVAGLHDCAE